MIELPTIPAWIAAQASGSWLELTSTQPNTVNPCPANNCSYSGIEGFPGIIDSWSGGCYDTLRNRLIVWGGGHNAYYGNEILAFDLSARTWSLIKSPAFPLTLVDLVGGIGINATGYYFNGTPAARHTYNTLQYDHVRDQIIVGYAGATAGEAGGVFRNCDVFDCVSNTWSVKAASPALGSNGSSYGTFAAIDAAGNYWMTYSGLSPLAKFSPAANTWTTYGSGYNYAGGPYCSAAVDTLRNRLVVIGGGYFTKTDLATPDTTINCGGSPTAAILNGTAPAWFYDTIGDRFVGWVNGQTLYTVDAATLLSWGTLSVSGDVPPNDSQAGQWRGTYGRGRYVAAFDTFVLVTQTNRNVFHYKFAR